MDEIINLEEFTKKEVKKLARRIGVIEMRLSRLIERRVLAALVNQSARSGGLAVATASAREAFDHAVEWCESNQERFIGRESSTGAHIVGRWQYQSNQIAIYPKTVRDILKSLQVDAETVLGEWREAGLIETGGDEKRYTKQMRVVPGKGPERVCVLIVQTEKPGASLARFSQSHFRRM